ncbi:MAG: hypothetical protein BroJett040_01900 [Oligoflexia bacterium]|nr:MAG: hypothetical protein BroJett040_01900 [Oligoflexia bacterium]
MKRNTMSFLILIVGMIWLGQIQAQPQAQVPKSVASQTPSLQNSPQPETIKNFRYWGDLQIDYKNELQPSSQKNHNAFSLPLLRFYLQSQIESDFGVQLGIQFGPLDSSSGEYRGLLKHGYLYMNNVFTEKDELRYGALLNPWIEMQEALWGIQDYSTYGDVLLKRYDYLPRVDLGVQYISRFEAGLWALSLVNGEGMNTADTGVKKDGQFHLELYPFSSLRSQNEGRFFLAMGYAYGAYDGVAENLAIKDKTLVSLGIRQNLGLSFWAEAFQGKDAVDKIAGRVSDAVDLSAQGGTLAKSEGAAGYLTYSFQRDSVRKWQVVLKGDWVTPYKGLNAKWVRSQSAGLVYQLRERLQLALLNSRAQYGENHSLSHRESENWSFSTRVNF